MDFIAHENFLTMKYYQTTVYSKLHVYSITKVLGHSEQKLYLFALVLSLWLLHDVINKSKQLTVCICIIMNVLLECM